MAECLEIGASYRTQEGKVVKIMEISSTLPGYETVKGDDGVCRYNRKGDYGRVTGSPHDYSYPGNFVQPIKAIEKDHI